MAIDGELILLYKIIFFDFLSLRHCFLVEIYIRSSLLPKDKCMYVFYVLLRRFYNNVIVIPVNCDVVPVVMIFGCNGIVRILCVVCGWLSQIPLVLCLLVI